MEITVLNRPKLLQAIEIATADGLITEFGREKEQISLRILDKGHRKLIEYTSLIASSPDKQDMDRSCNCSLGSDHLEIQSHMFREVFS